MGTREPDVLKEMAREIDAVIASKAANAEESLARAVRITDMTREIDAMRAGKAATDDESQARAVKITALEEKMGRP